jgi:hypothetical protein
MGKRMGDEEGGPLGGYAPGDVEDISSDTLRILLRGKAAELLELAETCPDKELGKKVRVLTKDLSLSTREKIIWYRTTPDCPYEIITVEVPFQKPTVFFAPKPEKE